MNSSSRTPKKSYYSYKYRARKKGMPFEITQNEFIRLVNKPCNYCGEVRVGGNGLDRLNPSKAYSLDNVVSCCSECNYMKGTMTASDFIYKVRKIALRSYPRDETPKNFYNIHINSAIESYAGPDYYG